MMTPSSIKSSAQIELESRPGHIRVVNATGTILHTNLGRALLSQAAIDAMVAVAGNPINLEYDLAAGKRGKREETLEQLIGRSHRRRSGDRGQQQCRRSACWD